ncbi:hypothetical protein FRC18_005141 [Serendipita sp. 400]|nr:hypothetical protein FRC18_005141 [Serendipita sp. 400]
MSHDNSIHIIRPPPSSEPTSVRPIPSILPSPLNIYLFSCQAWVYIQSFGMLTCLFAANGLLALRLIALYRRKKWLVWFIAAFYLSSYIATFGLVVNSMITYHSSIYYAAPVKSCAADAHSPTMAAIFYAPAAFETFVFFMTVYSAARDSKVITGSSAPFLTVLYRDGLICFVVMIGLRIWNCWIYITQPVSSYNMGTPLMWAVNVVVTTRIYINLVWLAKKPLITTNGLSINADVPTSAARASIHVKMPNSQSTFGSWKEPSLSANNEIEMLQTIPESIFERNLPIGKGFQSKA